MEAIYQFLVKGGILMIPILGCSVVALAFFLERLWSLQRLKVVPPGLVDIASRMVAEGRFSEAVAVCEGHPSPFSRILLAGIRLAGRRREVIQGAMEEQGRREVGQLERFVGVTGTIAAISPLLGLLGTVSGMITVFRQVVEEVAMSGQVNPGSLANGIWEALITTAAGLTVAIPAFVAHRYLLSRVDRLASELEEVSSSMLPYLEDRASLQQVAGLEGVVRRQEALPVVEPPQVGGQVATSGPSAGTGV